MSRGDAEAGVSHNGETLRAMVEAIRVGGAGAASPYFHPEIAWHAPPEWLERAVYRGHEGLRELAASWGQPFENYRFDVEQVIELDADRVLGLLCQRGVIKGTGHELKQAVSFLVRFRDGRLDRVDAYFSWVAGLEAAGLRRVRRVAGSGPLRVPDVAAAVEG
jgi:ketosteroid isomerase-like protein